MSFYPLIAISSMNSGGWVEQYEVEIDARTDDGSELPDSQILKFSNLKSQMKEASGRDFEVSYKIKDMLKQAGFVDVQEQRVKLPLGPWADDPKWKDIGRFFERFYKTGLQGWLLHICTRHLGVSRKSVFRLKAGTDLQTQWTVERVNNECTKAFQEVNSRQQHFYFPL